VQLGEGMGDYPEMPERVRIRLIVVGEDHGAGAEVAAASDGEGDYTAKTLRLRAR
jgi:hypothetical protein